MLMKKRKQTLDQLVETLCAYLRSMRRSDVTISVYCRKWGMVKTYMTSHRIKFYDQSVGERFLKSKLGNFDFAKLNCTQQDLAHRVYTLDHFLSTGTIQMGKKQQPPRVFAGAIGKAMSDFMYYRESTFKLSKVTMHSYQSYLHALLIFLNNKGIKSLHGITRSHVLSFVASINPHKLATKHIALQTTKSFFRHLHEEGLMTMDYSTIIPKDNYKHESHLPSVYSKEEVRDLLNAVDRSSPKGKRDYAILLLATKLGLRSSDIAALKFENILWEKNVIAFNQVKTGKPITLPLLPATGNAIIDYLKYGRPVSDENHCFLQGLSPYKKIDKDDLGQMVNLYFKRAGISIGNRKHGPHTLRHSLAGNLLKNKTLLPVITEVLGHSTSEATKTYLRIDVDTLKQCTLEVALVPASFYKQKGGYIL